MFFFSLNNFIFFDAFMFTLIRISRGTHFSKIYSTLSVESGLFAFMIFEVKNIEQEVYLVLCGIPMQVLELRIL
jgi:hypothetical protein